VRAAVCWSYGPPEVVATDDLPAPPLGPGQVRVRVDAAAVNFPDVLLVADEYQLTVPTPFVPGSEFAGAVAEVGDGVGGVAVGDRVAGTTLVGAFAEEVVVAADAVRAVPPGVDCATPRPSAWRTGRRTTSSARSPGCGPVTSSSCWAPAAASAWRPCSSAPCWARR
jgi:D-arabinose 1-dehydrogenase-like Zn-dependent alcohol dehydrogenase